MKILSPFNPGDRMFNFPHIFLRPRVNLWNREYAATAAWETNRCCCFSSLPPPRSPPPSSSSSSSSSSFSSTSSILLLIPQMLLRSVDFNCAENFYLYIITPTCCLWPRVSMRSRSQFLKRFRPFQTRWVLSLAQSYSSMTSGLESWGLNLLQNRPLCTYVCGPLWTWAL